MNVQLKGDLEENKNIFTRDKKEENSMLEGSIVKALILFAIPLILGNLLQQMYNTVDSIIVGNYVGSNALAAVGSSTSLIYLLIAFSQGTATGAGVIISQFIGAKNSKGLHVAVHTSLAIAIILGLFLSIVGFVFSPQILKLMKTPDNVMVESVVYLKYFSIGLVFNVIYNMAAGILNAVGNSKRSLLYLAIASITNIVLDLLLIRGFNMGVEGAAIATDLSQVISSILAVYFLMRINEDYKVNLAKIKLHKEMAIKIIKIGLPTGIQNMVISLSNVLIQSSINVFGSKTMAGFGAYLKIDGFNILPVMSLSMAATTFTGQNYGAGKIQRVKRGMYISLIMGLVYTILTGFLLLTFDNSIMGLFTQDKDVIEVGIEAMKYFCPFYFLLSILHALAGTVRGTGKTIPPMVVLLFSLCVFRMIFIKWVIPYFNTIQSIYILYPVSWAIGTFLMVLYAWKGKWIEKK